MMTWEALTLSSRRVSSSVRRASASASSAARAFTRSACADACASATVWSAVSMRRIAYESLFENCCCCSVIAPSSTVCDVGLPAAPLRGLPFGVGAAEAAREAAADSAAAARTPSSPAMRFNVSWGTRLPCATAARHA